MNRNPFGTPEDWDRFFGMPGSRSDRDERDRRSRDSEDDVYIVRYLDMFETRVRASSRSEAIREASDSDRWRRIGDLPVRNLEVR